jgi:hypothetical protein
VYTISKESDDIDNWMWYNIKEQDRVIGTISTIDGQEGLDRLWGKMRQCKDIKNIDVELSFGPLGVEDGE